MIDAGQIAEIQVGGASALAAPLGATEDGDEVLGLVSVARGDRAVHARRARAVRLPDRPGERLGRERRPARDRAAPGGHRRADRPLQPPALPGGHDRRGRARPALRPRARPGHARHRQLQDRQRRARPHPGRHGAGRGRTGPAPVLARDRRAGPLRRRGDGGRAAADRPRGRLPVRRARPRADRGARTAAGRRRRHAEGHGVVRGRLTGHRRRRHEGARGGRRGRRAVRGQAVGQEPTVRSSSSPRGPRSVHGVASGE